MKVSTLINKTGAIAAVVAMLAFSIAPAGVQAVQPENPGGGGGSPEYFIDGTLTQNGLLVDITNGVASSTNPPSNGNDHHISVNWDVASGDAATDYGLVMDLTPSGGNILPTAWATSTTYTAAGTYTIKVVIHHANVNGGESGSQIFSRTITVNPQCSDGIDNETAPDGLIDMDDPGCLSPTDDDEFNEPDPTNSPPVANSGSATTDEDTAVGITLTATDADADTLGYTVVDQPLHGDLAGTAPNLTYTPDPDYNGPDSFTFKANDGTDDSNVATISITVSPVNDPPSITLLGNTVVNIFVNGPYVDAGATASDIEDGDITGDIVVTGSVNNTLIGEYILSFNVQDGDGASAPTVTRTVNVNPELTECNDGIDNDDDGDFDLDDEGCEDEADNSESEVPVITLTGSTIVSVTTGDPYTDDGATADDAEDGDITGDIVVNGLPLDTNTAGTFFITYNVTDSDGNIAIEVTRTVVVSDPVLPPEDNLPACSDGEDNDGDQAIDLEDEDCAPFKPVLVIVKNTLDEADGIFDFNIEDDDDIDFNTTVTTSGGTGSTIITLDIAATFFVTELDEEGWDFVSAVCDDDNEDFTAVENGEPITVVAGETVTCTFTNEVEDTEQPTTGTLIVQKLVVNDNDGASVPGSFSFQINGGEPTGFDSDGVNEFIVAPGTYSVTEIETEEYEASYSNCTGVSVAAGETVTCTITNDDRSNGGGSSGSGSVRRGQVLGASTDGEVLGNICPLLTAYMREGMVNDPAQVTLLQQFLNGELGTLLEVTGFFGPMTTQAVNAFQSRYQPEVLAPWGPFGYDPMKPTGYVFKTTQWKVNSIACPELEIPFPQLP